MPAIEFDLDAKKYVSKVARTVGVPDMQIGWGLLELWEWCWLSKVETVVGEQLPGFFGDTRDVLVKSLVAFGFLEALEGDVYRVRGAGQRLGLSKARAEAGSRGGKTTAKTGKGLANLKQWANSPHRSTSEATPEANAAIASDLLRDVGEFPEATTEAAPKQNRSLYPSTLLPELNTYPTQSEKNLRLVHSKPRANKPKKLSPQQQLYAWLCEQRLDSLGPSAEPDATWGVPRINLKLKSIATLEPGLVSGAFHAFLEDPKAKELDPPCPLAWFVACFKTYARQASQEGAS